MYRVLSLVLLGASLCSAAPVMDIVAGEPSYRLESDRVTCWISVQGGHTLAHFETPRETVNPFFVAPWWNEADDGSICHMVRAMRGSFFCFPFGANATPYAGRSYPPHGQTANDAWLLRCDVSVPAGFDHQVALTMPLAGGEGHVDKYVRLRAGEPVVYLEHVIRGFDGRAPLGYHPNLKLPESPGAAIIDLSPPRFGLTHPEPLEKPAQGGYSKLLPGREFTDPAQVPCTDGDTWNVMRYPTEPGYEDLVMFINDPDRQFAFSAVTVAEEGYLYFQLKNPRVLVGTIFWMSNGGRHYAPWNGRNRAVLGLEEVTTYFAYGRAESVADNPLSRRGIRTAAEIDADKPYAVKLIIALVPVAADFPGVRDIVRRDAEHVTIIGKDGREIVVPCRVDFLQ